MRPVPARSASRQINIRMGALSGIARALYFCFPSASRGTMCEGAILHIEEVPLTVMCAHCAAVKTPAALYNFRCPDCGRPTPKVLTGREMQLVSIELVAPRADDVARKIWPAGDDLTKCRRVCT